jgi:2-methylcitrate dehydratase PrpD
MSGGDLAAAIVVGIEATCVIGLATLRSTDTRGFHQTGITGAFGAAAACGTLLGFDDLKMRRVLGIAATQAAGLRAVFGTMGKILNAGKPAGDGLLAAKLVDAGFSAPDEAIAEAGGFAAAFGENFDPQRPGHEMRGRLGIESTVYKYHANCQGTHSTIDAIRALRSQYGFGADAVRGIRVQVPAGLLGICGIAEPRDAHESQFSLAHAAALAAAGESTAPKGFTAAKVADARLRSLRQLVQVVPFPDSLPSESPVEITVTLASRVLPSLRADAHRFTADHELPDEATRLSQKGAELLQPILGVERSAALLSRLQSFRSAVRLRQLLEY